MADSRVRRDPERRAGEFLRQHLGHVLAPPIPVEVVAEASGALVVRTRLDEDLAGMLIRDGNRKVIAVAQDHAHVRQRYTIAHELGHLVMHPGRPLIAESAHAVRVDRRQNTPGFADQREEREANQFAAALLMPPAAVYEEWDRLGNSAISRAIIETLARRFDVSSQAMQYRLINMGLFIPPDED